MTLTVDLTPVEEARLTAAAHQAGVAPDMLLKKLVNSLPLSAEHEAMSVSPEQARVAAIKSARGSMAYVGVTVDELHQQRNRDKGSEERQVQGHFQ